ncbi:MAG: hypothetical protein ACK421_08350 [Pseudanabaenaceae cyanobacterium]
MKIIRNDVVEKPEISKTVSESYNKNSETVYFKDGYRITRAYNESKNTSTTGDNSFFCSLFVFKEKEGMNESVTHHYSNVNGQVQVSYGKSWNRNYSEHEMPVEEWKLEVECDD